MEKLLIPQVVVETPAYLHAVEEFWDCDTQNEFKNFIGVNFLSGDIIPNTGGLRKIRWKRTGSGFAYSKNVQDDLAEHEKKLLRQFVLQLKNSFRSKENSHNGQ